MGKRLVDKKHLMWVRTLPCFISRAGFLSCSGSVQAHHLLKGYDTPRGVNGRGMSLKNGDDQVIPLCQMHHHLLHTRYGSEKAFFKKYGIKEDAGKKYAKQLYEENDCYVEDNNDLPF